MSALSIEGLRNDQRQDESASRRRAHVPAAPGREAPDAARVARRRCRALRMGTAGIELYDGLTRTA
jgi:hypothetical protein